MKVKALRSFYVDAKVIEPGETVEVDDAVARGLIAANKAEPVGTRRRATAEPRERATAPQER